MSTTTKSRKRWTDDVIENELKAVSAELGQFPSRAELVARGQRGLWEAMRTGAGVDAWRERLGGNQPSVSADAIAFRAYELYEHGEPGGPMDHWLAAERQLAA